MKGKTRDRIRQKWGCQEERKFSSSDSLFFLRQKKCESLEKNPSTSKFYYLIDY